MTQIKKRGRPWRREVAKQAANAICDGWFNDITKAACAFFSRHIGLIPERQMQYHEIKNGTQYERFRDFRRYIIEDLKRRPKSLRIIRILREHTKKRNEQPRILAKQHAELLQRIKQDLQTPSRKLKQNLEESPNYKLKKALTDLFPPDLYGRRDIQALFRMNRTGAKNDRDKPE